MTNLIEIILAMLSFYNVIFIPLQFGFRIPFTGMFMTLEVCTIIFYLVDASLKSNKIARLKQIQTMTDFDLSKEDLKLKQDVEELNARKQELQ